MGMKHLIPILTLIVFVLLPACDDPHFLDPNAPVLLTATPQSDEDTIVIKGDGLETLIEFQSPSGIGRATIAAQGGRWPNALVLRFNLRDMEGFELNTGKYHLQSFLGAGDRVSYHKLDWRGNVDPSNLEGEVDLPIIQRDGMIDVIIPVDLLTKPSFTIQWVDFYRN